ncbi:MAG: hypothetical protein EOP06_28250 [Proteobacteria bacterium]|nr:MAG: hypothetical protein EOP06_28250 [Pseudomonadota bacterium]
MNSLPLANRILKIIALVGGLFFGAVVLLVLYADRAQAKRDHQFEQRLLPSIQFVQTFESTKGRLPSEQEFTKRSSAKTDWMIGLITKNSSDVAFASHGGKRNKDFCLRIWRGESWTYYFSWNGKFDIVEP